MKKHFCIVSVLYRLFFLFMCGYGILMHFKWDDADNNTYMFSFFTVQSNIFCFIIMCIILFRQFKEKDVIYTPFVVYFKGMATMAIIVTFIVFHFMVAIYKYPLLQDGILCLPQKDLFVHYLIPLTFVLDWIFFQPKGIYRIKYIFYWFLFPLFYFASIMTRCICNPPSAFYNIKKFPYFFLDFEALGVGKFFWFLFILTIIILFVNCILVLADFLLGLRNKKNS